MANSIFKSSIWRNTLDEQSEFSLKHKEEVERLRVCFKKTRENAGIIADNIKESQKGLTLHDINHLDALWETASTIIGETPDLNPIEAFVFGCAVLFHDLGMALVLWDEQLSILKESSEYKDTLFSIYSAHLKRQATPDELVNVPVAVEHAAISSRLRELHAFKAKEVVAKTYSFGSQSISIIEDIDLRNKLSTKIGDIAESHWWDVDRIRSSFADRPISPSPTGFPPEWKINNVKISCLLRLADFINIDDRRAPVFQYSFLRPEGLSELHWNFQSKLNRAFITDDRLIFESHNNFKYEESKAWWLAFSTISEIDREIRSVDNLLNDLSIKRFRCKGIKGIEDPILFSNYVKTEGWEPANTQLKISDFRSLVEKFGGKHLYGDRPEIVLRELIQNACDAIQAKEYYTQKYNAEIQINYYVDKQNVEWLEIEDNGIGMSKSVLLYSLLDFGNSYWKSSLVRKEHPGLISSGFVSNGNFGVGFFSVFMIADLVQIVTKPVNEGASTIVLEFNDGIASNPVFRKAKKPEERIESGTLIRIKSKIGNLLNTVYRNVAELSDVEVEDSLAYSCRIIAPALPVTLSVKSNGRPKQIIVQGNDWMQIDAIALLKRISGFGELNTSGWNIDRLKYISEFVRPIYSKKNGQMVARATIVKKFPVNNSYSGRGIVTVGGLKQSILYRFPGVWVGQNEVVARNYAYPICEYDDLGPWLEEQYRLILASNKLNERETHSIAQLMYSLGFPCEKLPIAHTLTGLKTYEDLTKMNHGDHVLIRPTLTEEERSFLMLPDIIYADYGTPLINIDYENYSGSGLWEDSLRNFSSNSLNDEIIRSRSLFGFTIKAICKSWDIDENEVIKESLIDILQWQPSMEAYKNKYNEPVRYPVAVVVNPRLTTKKNIYKKYEQEIKRWIGIPDDISDFDISKFA